MLSTMSNTTFIPATWSFYEMIQAVYQAPAYHLIFEAVLIVAIVKLFFSKSYEPGKILLTEKEKETLIEEWTPLPLVPDIQEDHPVLVSMKKNIITGRIGKDVMYGEKLCLNMGSFNFLNFTEDKAVIDKAVETLRVYGVGSCGPRGFYGTMDVHLKLEDELAKFMRCEEAIVYSYGFATIASIIPAYSKRTDVIFCDEGACFSIQKGIEASRSKVHYFRHNDLDHLEELLIKQQKDDIKNPKKAKITRRFLIVEGLYINHGDICPLPQLVALKHKYKVRIFLEESFSFGVLGKTGRGVTEHYGVNVDDIDAIAGSLENSFATIGGFCVGRKYVIDHQRLSAQGYCFSASQPPLLAAAAMKALTIMSSNPGLLEDLQEKCKLVHRAFSNLDGLRLIGDEISPIKHLQLIEPSEDWNIDMCILDRIVDEARECGIGLTVARYLTTNEVCLCAPSIRLTVNRAFTESDIANAADTIQTVCRNVIP